MFDGYTGMLVLIEHLKTKRRKKYEEKVISFGCMYLLPDVVL
jgi:hypothetical protein